MRIVGVIVCLSATVVAVGLPIEACRLLLSGGYELAGLVAFGDILLWLLLFLAVAKLDRSNDRSAMQTTAD